MIERFASASPYENVIGYSRVVRAGDWFHTAGCTAVVDGVLTGVGDAAAQTRTALDIALSALAAAGCPREHVATCRIYLTDREHAEAAGQVHRELLGDVRPAAAMIVVAGFIDPDMLVEVELSGYAPAAGSVAQPPNTAHPLNTAQPPNTAQSA